MKNMFRRSNYDMDVIEVKRIYPKGWFLFVFIIEMFFSIMGGYYYKVLKNMIGVVICMSLFYIIAIAEFAFRYIKKNDYFIRDGYSMGVNTLYYHNKVKMLILSNIGMATGCLMHFFVQRVPQEEISRVDQNYWIWFSLILFLLCFEPFNDITTGFYKNYFLTDRYVVNLTGISEIRVIKERNSTKGTVCEIELYKDKICVGTDRVFEDDLAYMKRIIL